MIWFRELSIVSLSEASVDFIRWPLVRRHSIIRMYRYERGEKHSLRAPGIVDWLFNDDNGPNDPSADASIIGDGTIRDHHRYCHRRRHLIIGGLANAAAQLELVNAIRMEVRIYLLFLLRFWGFIFNAKILPLS